MIHTDPNRAYRQALRPAPGETFFQVVAGESDLRITARTDLSEQVGAYLAEVRAGLTNHILLHPEFRHSLTPLPVEPGEEQAPPVVRAMLQASRLCQVGPMAAVAGAVAQAVADKFSPLSPDILVENGGDIYIHTTRPRLVALLAKPVQGARLALRVEPGESPLALCGSSATIGHSLSFGAADLVTVKARSGALADAAATTLGNLARSPEHLPLVLERAQEMAAVGVLGVFAQVGGQVGVWGDMELAVLEDGQD